MLKNRLIAILVSFINLLIVLLLIAFVIENTFINILLGIYVIIFSSIMSFLSRDRGQGGKMLNIQHLEKLKSLLSDQKLIAVTKYVGQAEMRALIAENIKDFGENRVNIFLEKYEEYEKENIVWHFIGHLQSKKVKKMINKIDFLHSLDRLSLADQIEKHRENVLSCFIEVNISNDSNKYGLTKENVFDFYNKIKDYDKIEVIGFMGMAEHTSNPALIKKQFQVLLDLKNKFDKLFSKSHKLSMGMSNDFEIAIEMGASHLRIGSYLFEED